MPVAEQISSMLNSSPSLNMSSTKVWNKDTCSSFLPCDTHARTHTLHTGAVLRRPGAYGDGEAYLFELGSEHGVPQGGLPLQLAAAVLAQVEQLEHLLQLHHLGRRGSKERGQSERVETSS